MVGQHKFRCAEKTFGLDRTQRDEFQIIVRRGNRAIYCRFSFLHDRLEVVVIDGGSSEGVARRFSGCFCAARACVEKKMKKKEKNKAILEMLFYENDPFTCYKTLDEIKQNML